MHLSLHRDVQKQTKHPGVILHSRCNSPWSRCSI
jgi:hypothetical protein